MTALPRKGDVIAGRYRITSALGEGGMGAVFAADDSVLGREVAIKVLRASVATRADSQKRFLREAKVAAALTHPNAIRIFDFGADRGRPFMAMERLHGQNLGDKIIAEGPLSVAMAVKIAYDIADVLSAAHATGLIHRDIKPDNIFLEAAGGRVRVLDFGMAFLLESDDPDVGRLTTDGLSGGTPAYMSPEQCGGLISTSATDIYGLGCVLFEALTGEPPFAEASTTKYFIRHLYDLPPRIASVRADVPKALDELVARALSKHPDDRPSAASVRQRLAALEETALGARERSRDASYLSNRAARALPRPTPALPTRDPQMLKLLIIADEEDDDLRLGLATMRVLADFGSLDALGDHDAVYLIDPELEVVAHVIVDVGERPVLVGATDAAIADLKAFLRLGVRDVVTRPRSAAQLASKLRRLKTKDNREEAKES